MQPKNFYKKAENSQFQSPSLPRPFTSAPPGCVTSGLYLHTDARDGGRRCGSNISANHVILEEPLDDCWKHCSSCVPSSARS